jgi:processing peptidase subunit alpha
MLRPATTRAATRLLKTAPRNSRSLITSTSSAIPPTKDPVELDELTTLPNGIRVATEALPGHFSGIGVYIDAGSRFENGYLSGVSHIIDRLAFKSTTKRSGDQMLESLESLGGNIQCASSRESLMYQSATFNSAVPTTVALLAETIRDPLITEQEIEQQRETAEYEISEIWSKPELILPELVHMAAYKDNTLGNPLLCPAERLPFINRDVIETYRKAFYRPERMVVAFAGVDHPTAVKLTEEYFGDMKGEETPVLSQVGAEATLDSTESDSADSGRHTTLYPFEKSILTLRSIFKTIIRINSAPARLTAPLQNSLL